MIPIISFLVITEGKGAYKLSSCLGCSSSIDESKKRSVFLYELQSSTKPDTLNILDERKIFIEQGFRYGEWSASNTDSLKIDDFFKYQVVLEGENSCPVNFYRINDYWIKGEYRFFEIPDTIYLDIYRLADKPADSVREIGKLLLFKK